MFMWSPQSYLAGNEVVTSHSDALSLVSRLAQPVSGMPEVILAFVYNTLSASDISLASGAYQGVSSTQFAELKSAVKGSQSSLSASQVTTQPQAFSEALVSTIVAAHPEAVVVVSAGDGDGCQSLLTQLQDRSSMFNDMKTDLVLVKGVDPTHGGSCLSALESFVNSQSNGKYLSLLSADAPSASVTTMFPDLTADRMAFATFADPVVTATTSENPGPQYITSNILLGLFVSFTLVFITIFMICCTMSIESPLRYTATPLVISKEY
jgi:hypothetical protein